MCFLQKNCLYIEVEINMMCSRQRKEEFLKNTLSRSSNVTGVVKIYIFRRITHNRISVLLCYCKVSSVFDLLNVTF